MTVCLDEEDICVDDQNDDFYVGLVAYLAAAAEEEEVAAAGPKIPIVDYYHFWYQRKHPIAISPNHCRNT